MNKYEFKVVKNNLYKELPILYVENEYFYVKIYLGDILFEDSVWDGPEYIVKHKKSSLLLEFDPNTEMIKFNLMPFVFIDKIDELIQQIEIIRQSSLELKIITDKMIKEFETEMTESESGIQFLLIGKRYENGIGVAKNVLKAYEWYKKAADAGNTTAKKILLELR